MASATITRLPTAAPAPVKNPRGHSASAAPISIAQIRRLMAAEEARKHNEWVEQKQRELTELERRARLIRRCRLPGTSRIGGTPRTARSTRNSPSPRI